MSWFRDGISSVTDGIGANTYFAYNVVLPNKTGKLKGVHVNGYGDCYVYNQPLFKPVNILYRYLLFFKANNPSPITKYLGSVALKLYTKTYSLNPFQKSNLTLPNRFNNPVYNIFYLYLKPDSQY